MMTTASLLVTLDQVSRQLELAGFNSPTLVTVAALINIVDEPNQTATEVMKGYGLAWSNAQQTQIADRLERVGLIERKSHPLDRRKKLLCPTTKGIALVSSAIQAGNAASKAPGKHRESALNRESVKARLRSLAAVK